MRYFSDKCRALLFNSTSEIERAILPMTDNGIRDKDHEHATYAGLAVSRSS
ncbi:hypothetical protein DPMN_116556 [Dreissena polymorpha]|uniref:Uncharacterized protein n=1 Tax=Dreissena polymorpha TaxID=45954 RepID=A0A9D4KP59_DREPO|nr:hypothetical protein DPMN_116556 [Dreissena polymorpha]